MKTRIKFDPSHVIRRLEPNRTLKGTFGNNALDAVYLSVERSALLVTNGKVAIVHECECAASDKSAWIPGLVYAQARQYYARQRSTIVEILVHGHLIGYGPYTVAVEQERYRNGAELFKLIDEMAGKAKMTGDGSYQRATPTFNPKEFAAVLNTIGTTYVETYARPVQYVDPILIAPRNEQNGPSVQAYLMPVREDTLAPPIPINDWLRRIAEKPPANQEG